MDYRVWACEDISHMFLGLALLAGVVKLVDALDSKSSGPCVRVGSIPTSGTRKKIPNAPRKGFRPDWSGAFSVFPPGHNPNPFIAHPTAFGAGYRNRHWT